MPHPVSQYPNADRVPSFAQTYRRYQEAIGNQCPIESGFLGRLADRECEHGNLPGEDECGCWPKPPNPLRRRRLMLGFTKARLAVEAGVSESTITRLEQGERPFRESAERLAFALACEPQWLFPGESRVKR